MERIFTARLFRSSAGDQVAGVEAVLADVEKNCGRFLDAEAEKRAARIHRKAATRGILKG